MENHDAEEPALAELRRAVRALVAGEPRELSSLRERLEKARQVLRSESLQALTPMLTAHAEGFPKATYEDKRTFARWLNEELRANGLAIRCPKTGKPTMLEVNPGHTPTIGRFRFDYLDEQAGHHTTFTSVDLPPLEFVVDPTMTARGRVRSGRGR